MASRSEKQKQASIQNFCFRAMKGLARNFRMSGHYDFEKKVEALEDEFRDKLKQARRRK
jgi:hypothetical protein